MIYVSQVGGRRLGCFRHNFAARYASDWRFRGPSAKPTHEALEANISRKAARDLLRFRRYSAWFTRRGRGWKQKFHCLCRKYDLLRPGALFDLPFSSSSNRQHTMSLSYRRPFSSFLSARSEEKWIVLLPCGPPADGISYPGSLTPKVWLGRNLCRSLAI